MVIKIVLSVVIVGFFTWFFILTYRNRTNCYKMDYGIIESIEYNMDRVYHSHVLCNKENHFVKTNQSRFKITIKTEEGYLHAYSMFKPDVNLNDEVMILKHYYKDNLKKECGLLCYK